MYNDTYQKRENKLLNIKTEQKIDYWGVFEKRKVLSSFNNQESGGIGGSKQFSRIVLVGSASSEDAHALYVKDNNRPIVLAGKARVRGDVYLPEAGIRMGSVGGYSYNNEQLIFGKQKRSKTELPKLEKAVLESVWFSNNLKVLKAESGILKPKMTLERSFNDETIVLEGSVAILTAANLTGNIVVRASDKIIVEPSSILKDIILMAPIIEIKDGVQGYFQAIATKNIMVGRKCNLSYPTALVVNSKEVGLSKNRDKKATIEVSPYTYISGAIVFLGTTDEKSYTPQIKIHENAVLKGELYCSKNLELKGKIEGFVHTDGFIALENGTTYQNHLYNGIIDIAPLPLEYAGLLIEETKEKRIVKWLY